MSATVTAPRSGPAPVPASQTHASSAPERARLWLITLALALIWLAVSPPTPDLAAHEYRADVVDLTGLGIWEQGWYAGHHLPGYSVLFPPAGALLTPGARRGDLRRDRRLVLRAAGPRLVAGARGDRLGDVVRGRRRLDARRRPARVRRRSRARARRTARGIARPDGAGGDARRGHDAHEPGRRRRSSCSPRRPGRWAPARARRSRRPPERWCRGS